MGIMNTLKRVFSKKEPELYTPQREYIDRRHDALQRQISYYQKKREIPLMEQKVKLYEKQVYGNTIGTKDENNILKVPNYFKNEKKQFRRGML